MTGTMGVSSSGVRHWWTQTGREGNHTTQLMRTTLRWVSAGMMYYVQFHSNICARNLCTCRRSFSFPMSTTLKKLQGIVMNDMTNAICINTFLWEFFFFCILYIQRDKCDKTSYDIDIAHICTYVVITLTSFFNSLIAYIYIQI